MERYQDKKVVIIGGTSGMGLATAKMLLDGGARVVVTGRSKAGLESAEKELGKGAVTASSEFHSAELDFSNLQGERRYNWWGAYTRSKLCNILFTYELSRRLAGSTITANCFSPGPTLTRLGDNMRGLPAAVPWLLKRIPSLLALPEGAARTPVYLASSPDLDGVSGRFFRQCRETRTKQITYDNSVAVRLWNMSQALYESRASAGLRTE